MERQNHFEDRAGQDRGEDLRHADPKPQPDLPQNVDRDDDRGHVQPRIADVRQDNWVATVSERERSVGHIVSHNASSIGGSLGLPVVRSPRRIGDT